MTGSLVIVMTTFDDPEVAARVASELVEAGLVACAQVETSPVRSTWRWEGKVESGEEWRMMLKLPPHSLDALRERLLVLHPYETPEFIALEGSASEAYARWARESCS
jgi:periplasmic divalent cation tolerance protein